MKLFGKIKVDKMTYKRVLILIYIYYIHYNKLYDSTTEKLSIIFKFSKLT